MYADYYGVDALIANPRLLADLGGWHGLAREREAAKRARAAAIAIALLRDKLRERGL